MLALVSLLIKELLYILKGPDAVIVLYLPTIKNSSLLGATCLSDLP